MGGGGRVCGIGDERIPTERQAGLRNEGHRLTIGERQIAPILASLPLLQEAAQQGNDQRQLKLAA